MSDIENIQAGVMEIVNKNGDEINNNSCINSAVGYGVTAPKEVLARSRLIVQALRTHKEFNNEDINYTLKALLGTRLLKDEIYQQLSKFITHINKKSYTGRFSLLYNYDFDQSVKGRNIERVQLLSYVDSESSFPELYENEYLSEKEKEGIEKQYQREVLATYNTIDHVSSSRSGNNSGYGENLLYPCSYTLEGYMVDSDGVKSGKTLYNECYKEVCIFEKDVMGEDVELYEESGVVNNTLLMPQYSNEDGMFYIKCYTILDIIDKAYRRIYKMERQQDVDEMEERKMNISGEMLNMVKKRFGKELNMYRYYKDVLNRLETNPAG